MATTTKKIENTKGNLIIEREKFTSKKGGREFWGYFVQGMTRGKLVKARFLAPDNGGYDLLDIVFGDENTAQLVLVPYEMTDEKTGEVRRGFTYEAQNIDETDGELYRAPIKPTSKTDKIILEKLLEKLNKQAA